MAGPMVDLKDMPKVCQLVHMMVAHWVATMDSWMALRMVECSADWMVRQKAAPSVHLWAVQ